MTASETLRIERTAHFDDPAVVAGDRAYLIGAQHGGFPDIGWHTPGEMGGLWAHPIKLFDGFRLAIDGTWLGRCDRFVAGPFWNEFTYRLDSALSLTRRQFVPDGIPAVCVRLTLLAPRPTEVRLRIAARSDLQGVWPRPADGPDPDTAEFLPEHGVALAEHPREPWCAAVGSISHIPDTHDTGAHVHGPEESANRGVGLSLEYTLALDGEHATSLDLVLCGCDGGRAETLASFDRCRGHDTLWDEKARRSDRLRAVCTLAAPDAPLTGAWDWIKCNLDWMVREVPGVGRGIGGGLPDYPWWFGCDGAYAALGALALGRADVAIDTLDLLRRQSEVANGNSGRVLHECNTRGETTHPGNTQETPHVAAAVWETFRWTGDTAFLTRMYDFCRRGVLDWTLGTRCRDGDLLPYGFGITEVLGLDLQCLDSATHTYAALDALAGMATALGDGAVATCCAALAPRLAARIEEAFWLPDEGMYGDMLATPDEMIPRLTYWIEQAGRSGDHFSPEAVAGLSALLDEARCDPHPERKRAWLLRNWIVILPLVEGIAAPSRVAAVLDRVESAEFSGPHGMYLNGLARREMMSINTGVLAGCEIAHGRPERGLAYLDLLARTLDLHLPGAISEMSPDGGCCVQAWSSFALAWPVVRGLFGLQPDAHLRRLTVRPSFPPGWAPARLECVPVGETLVDLHWDGRTLEVRIEEPGWTVIHDGTPERLQVGAG